MVEIGPFPVSRKRKGKALDEQEAGRDVWQEVPDSAKEIKEKDRRHRQSPCGEMQSLRYGRDESDYQRISRLTIPVGQSSLAVTVLP
jgi:hypothetical protein